MPSHAFVSCPQVAKAKHEKQSMKKPKAKSEKKLQFTKKRKKTSNFLRDINMRQII